MATQYQVNYEDERFKNVETEKQAALNESNSLYNEMIGNSDKYYQSQIDAAKGYAAQQKEIQEQNTQFAIEQVNQQKEQLADKEEQITDLQKEVCRLKELLKEK